jgi:hypothetical protein
MQPGAEMRYTNNLHTLDNKEEDMACVVAMLSSKNKPDRQTSLNAVLTFVFLPLIY